MPLLDTDSTIADVRTILKNIGLVAEPEEICAMWRVRPKADLHRALREHHEERWARNYLVDALSDAQQSTGKLTLSEDAECSTGSAPRRAEWDGTSSRAFKMPYRSSVPSIFDRTSRPSPLGAMQPSPLGVPCEPNGQLIVCGATTALRFTPDRGANCAPAVWMEAAPPCSGRRYDWSRKVDFLLEQDHLSMALMVVTGHLSKASFFQGPTKERTMVDFVDGRSRVVVSIRRGSEARNLSIGPKEALALAALIAAQIEAGLQFVPRGDISLLICRTVGRMTAAVSQVAAESNRSARAGS